MLRPQHKGIFRNTFLLSFLMMVLIIVLFTALTIPRQHTAILKSIEAQANGISSSIAQVCANAIAMEDYAFIVEHNLQVLQGSPHILYVIVVHRNGFSLVHTRNRWEQRETPDPQWQVGSEEITAGRILYSDLVEQNVFHYALPLKYSVVSWGSLYLGVSLKDFNKETKTMYVIISLLSLFCLITGLLGAYIFAKKLTRPILALRQATNQLAQGDLSVRARITTRDELNDLAVSFNQMAENLEKTTVSKDFVRNILETMTESLVVTTATGLIRMVNQATLNLLGYTEQELLDQPLHILFAWEEEKMGTTWIDDLMPGDLKQNSEHIFRSKTGDLLPITVFSRLHVQ